MKVLFDLFPILLFFAAFKIKGIFFATAVAIGASFVQIGWTYARHRKVDPMLWVSLGIIVVFGGATLAFHNETFIKWKPTVLYWFFAVALAASDLIFRKNLMESMLKEKVALPPHAWRTLSLSWALFFALLGVVNLFVAYRFSTSAWVNFKVFGTTALMLVFVILQGLYLSKYMEEGKEP